MTRTTPDRPFDLEALFPELAGYARGATRLHPRAGSPSVQESSVGGPLLWPADEPWPTCSGPHGVWMSGCATADDIRHDRAAQAAATGRAVREGAKSDKMTPQERTAFLESRRARRAAQPSEPEEPEFTALVPIAQLYARDIPDLKTPPGTDLLQVLWCPFDHDSRDGEGPAVTLRWRDSSTVGALLEEPPEAAGFEYEDYLPDPCVLHPERITEYPLAVHLHEELDPGLCERIAAWCREIHSVAPQAAAPELSWMDADPYDEMSATHTWKIGGWPFWSFRDPMPIRCKTCTATMTPLLQIGSGEWFTDLGYWTPFEDLPDILACPLPRHTFGNPPHIALAHGYRLQVYVCPDSYGHPPRQYLM